MTAITLEKNAAFLEYKLSQGAVVPGLGILAGVTKAVLGTAQTIAGLTTLIFSSPWICTKDGGKISARAFSHTVNGVANIVAGVVEACPVVGTAIFAYRYYRTVKFSEASPLRISGQEHAIIFGYRLLEEKAIVSYELPSSQYQHETLSTSPCISL